MQQRLNRFLTATAIATASFFAFSAAQAETAASATPAASAAHSASAASAAVAASAASAPQAVGDGAAVNLTAKITKVFPSTNSVELKGPEGKTVVIDVDPNIANVKKLKAGDDVHVAYRAAILMSADKVDAKGAESRMTAEQTLPASNGVVVKTAGVQVVAVIQKIDAKTREVTLAGPKRVITMQVQPDIQLDKFKVGDSVMATYVGATAIDVTRNGQIVK
jgi:Cu/Ag efflux protein CusF